MSNSDSFPDRSSKRSLPISLDVIDDQDYSGKEKIISLLTSKEQFNVLVGSLLNARNNFKMLNTDSIQVADYIFTKSSAMKYLDNILINLVGKEKFNEIFYKE